VETPPPAAPAATPVPVRPPSRPAEYVEIDALGDVLFAFDKATIRASAAKRLDAAAAWLKANPEHLLLIEGHADERGTNEYNLALGERRAKAAMTYLESRGVAASRMTVLSYGEERPRCSEHAESCWATNRRAHFLVKPR
jgi:peptidoglycan-associated lipoprotein